MSDGVAFVWRVKLNNAESFYVVAENHVEAARLASDVEDERNCAIHSIEWVGRCISVQSELFAG